MTYQVRNRCILDLRGLVLQSYYSNAKNAVDTVEGAGGKRIPAAVHGLNNFIQSHLNPVLEKFAPIDVIAVQEGAHANHRRRCLSATYKADKSQDEADEAMEAQKELLMTTVVKLLLAIGCVVGKTAYAEADDTIGYLIKNLKGKKVVRTVDNDLLQLDVYGNTLFLIGHDYVNSFKGMKLKPYNPVLLYKSLVGDTSDNIPGITRFGEGKWGDLIEKYGSDAIPELEACVAKDDFTYLEEVLAETPCKLLQFMYDNRHQWSVSYKLASIRPDWCESTFGGKVIRPKWEKRIPTVERLTAALEPFGLFQSIADYKQYCIKTWLLDAKQLAKTPMDKLYSAMRDSEFIAFDYESYDSVQHEPYQRAKKSGGYVDMLSQVVTGASFAFGDNMQYCFYVPTKHRDTYNCKPEELAAIINAVKDRPIAAHNDMFEQVVSKTNFDIDFDRMMDTGITGHYVDENVRHALKIRSKSVLNYNQTSYRDIVPEGKDMRDISGAEVLNYGCDDSLCSAHILIVDQIIMECEQTWDFYYDNETFVTRALLPGFIAGIPMDWDRLQELSDADDGVYRNAEDELRELLAEHCPTVNEEGFKLLWDEIRPYETAKMEEKEKSNSDISEELCKKETKLYADCKYNPLVAPEVTTKKSTIALVAKMLNMPTIRSVKEAWMDTYYNGVQAQLENGATITETQKEFLNLLYNAVKTGDDEIIDTLQGWMAAFINTDKSVWDGDQLNCGSPDQMARLFYGKMGLPILLRNQSKDGKDKRSQFELEGAPSTSENAIRTWMPTFAEDSWQYRVLDCVLRIRGVRTRRSLYYKPYPLWQSPTDGRTHPQIRNCGTVTRRPSGTSYNILQVSKTKDEGHTRSVFLPQTADRPVTPSMLSIPATDEKNNVIPGKFWEVDVNKEMIVSIDFVQEELLIMAGESNDPALRACYQGEVRRDVHTTTGAMIYNQRNPDKKAVSYDEFANIIKTKADKDEPDITRRASVIRQVYSKRTNFLLTYGGGAAGLARKLIVPKQMAEGFVIAFNEAYPLIAEFQERAIREARQFGYSRACFGTRRHLFKIFDNNRAISASAERQSGNFKIQGCAAEILKIVLRKVATQNVLKRYGATLYAPVYDELVLSCPIHHIYALVNELADIMEMELPGLNIRLLTSVSVGFNWGEQAEVGERPSLEAITVGIATLLRKAAEKAEKELEEVETT